MPETTQIQASDDSSRQSNKGGLTGRQKDDLRKALNVVDSRGNPAKYAVPDAPCYRDSVEASLKNSKWSKEDIAKVVNNLNSLVTFNKVDAKNNVREGFKAVLVDDLYKICATLLGAEVVKTN